MSASAGGPSASKESNFGFLVSRTSFRGESHSFFSLSVFFFLLDYQVSPRERVQVAIAEQYELSLGRLFIVIMTHLQSQHSPKLVQYAVQVMRRHTAAGGTTTSSSSSASSSLSIHTSSSSTEVDLAVYILDWLDRCQSSATTTDNNDSDNNNNNNNIIQSYMDYDSMCELLMEQLPLIENTSPTTTTTSNTATQVLTDIAHAYLYNDFQLLNVEMNDTARDSTTATTTTNTNTPATFDYDWDAALASLWNYLVTTSSQQVSYEAATQALEMVVNQVVLAQEQKQFYYNINDWVAQIAYSLIVQAQQAPPVCRHFITHGKCYRKDCQFSHNANETTCLFWMRGHCNKRTECHFLHGFVPSRCGDILQEYGHPPPFARNTSSTRTDTAHTTNVIHPPPPGILPQENHHSSNYSYTGTTSNPSTADGAWSTGTRLQNTHSSFANIARNLNQGGGMRDTHNTITKNTTTQNASKIPTVPLPQHLWNVHENRDAAAFYIQDPLERFYYVMQNTAAIKSHSNVMDLHFQSTQTFGTVLEHLLPEYLERYKDQGVWIITGTGHHVGSSTHQKGGGVLERAVIQWLMERGFRFARAKDKSGQGGAILVQTSY